MPEAGAQRTCRGHVLAKSASSQDSSDIVEGLCGANCRHNFFPTWEGVDDVYPKELLEEYTRKDAYSYNGKKMSEYEATQVQRKIDRNIRKWQREFITMEAAGQDTMEASVKIRSWSEKEADFLRRTGLKKQSGSSQIPGFGRSQSGIASRKAEEYYAVWSKSLGIDDAIKTLAKYYDVKYNDSPRYELLRKYVQSVHSGKLSPMSHFDLYELYYKEIQDKFIGCSVNGVEITSQSQHFLERVFGCMCDPKTGLPRNGAELQDVFDAVLHPTSIDGIKVDEHGKRSFAVYGHRAKVTINPDTGMLIQTNRWRG